MTDIAHTKFHDTEIAKAEDFIYTAASFITMMSAIMDGLSYDVINSFVVAGLSVDQAATPSMSVRIRPGMAFSKAESKFLHLGSDLAVSVSPADADLDRIDTVEIRQASTDIGLDSRAFKDPISGGVSYANVYTRTKVSIEARCIAGTPGAGIAPAVESGWMKLSEVDVPAETTEIITALIHNVSSEADGVANDAWTEEEDTTFHLGSVSYIKDMVHDHLADDITSSNTVHGIRQGSGNGLDADKLDGMQPAAAATASTIAQRDANGRAQFAEPAVAADAAVLKTVTDHAALTEPHSATAAATASRLMLRDASGRCAVANPSADGDAANKGWVRDFIHPVGSYYTQYPDASSNDDGTEFPTTQRPATLFGGTWAEQWSTESVYFRTRGTLSGTDRVDGTQPDAFQGHKHIDGVLYSQAIPTQYGSESGPTSGNVQDRASDVTSRAYTSTPISDGTFGTPRTALETRVVNRRIKVWKRTA